VVYTRHQHMHTIACACVDIRQGDRVVLQQMLCLLMLPATTHSSTPACTAAAATDHTSDTYRHNQHFKR
jgi:hypothetical protein